MNQMKEMIIIVIISKLNQKEGNLLFLQVNILKNLKNRKKLNQKWIIKSKVTFKLMMNHKLQNKYQMKH